MTPFSLTNSSYDELPPSPSWALSSVSIWAGLSRASPSSAEGHERHERSPRSCLGAENIAQGSPRPMWSGERMRRSRTRLAWAMFWGATSSPSKDPLTGIDENSGRSSVIRQPRRCERSSCRRCARMIPRTLARVYRSKQFFAGSLRASRVIPERWPGRVPSPGMSSSPPSRGPVAWDALSSCVPRLRGRGRIRTRIA